MAHINLIPGEQGVRLSTLSPKYLHTNSTSHTWPFSAIAELIDNAYDPDVDASQLWIDIERYGFEQCLTFTDNGAGMDSLKLHKMLSFGFCEKVAKNDHLPVGHYGNGFKSGSMRLGKDAIVFTKHKESRSVGFLSQTYLETVKAQTILVPIVSWDAEDNMVERSDGDRALQDILKYSLFRSNVDIMGQFNKIKSLTGTRIVINNMRRTREGKYEFDFKTYYNDIRIPDDVELDSYKYKRQERQYHIPESDYSLRAYCSILYLKPRMQIMLRGSKVKTTVIAKSLSKTEVDTYKPQGVARPIKVTFGFSQNKNHYGIMMYHRNRLIKPYVRVGYQLKANNLGVGVIGVIQCDYLQPTHNKQDFDYTKAYRSSMSALGSKLNDYWNEKKGRLHANSTAAIPEPKEVESRPDQLWVQCDNPECLKWRKLPHGISPESLPEKWYCTDHPEERWRSCDVPEELEEEADESVQPYVKKQKKRLEKELEEKKKREKEAKRLKELELEVKAKELKKKEAEIKKLIQIVENKSKEQQQQQQRGAVKKETASPQKLQIKVVGPAVQRQQQTTPTKKIVVQNSNSKVILSPLSSSQTLTVKTPTSVSPMMQTSGTPTRTIFKKPETATQSVQLVKVMSGNPPQITNQKNPLVINLGKVTVAQPGMAPKVSGPPVVLKVNSKAAAEQVQYLPTMVPVTAVVDPKVVSVQSLANPRQQTGATNILIKASATNTPINVAMPTNITIKATPGASMATPGAAPMVAPGIAMVTSKAAVTTSGPVMATPGNSMATGTAMAIPGNSMATQVKTETETANSNRTLPQKPVIKTESQSQQKSSTNEQTVPPSVKEEPTRPSATSLKRKHDQTSDDSHAAKQKKEADIIIIDPPSPPPLSPVSSIGDTFRDLPDISMDGSLPNMDSNLPNMDTNLPNMDSNLPNMDSNLPNMDSNLPNIGSKLPNMDTSSTKKEKQEVDKLIKDCKMVNIDKDVVDEVKAMLPMQQLQALLTRTQQLKQLYSLRENVLKLLRVLVPELDVTDDLKNKYEDQTVDELLKQVLEQAEKTDADGMDS